MKTGFIIFSIALITTLDNLQAKEAESVRDPFWPIGYAPAEPVEEKPIEEPKPVVVEKPKPPPPPKPVTAEEWKMARKLLKVSGYALADKKGEDAAKRTSIVIINRNHYTSGEIIKITNKDIEFIWRVGEIRNNSVELKQESATRLNKTPAKSIRRKAPRPGVMK